MPETTDTETEAQASAQASAIEEQEADEQVKETELEDTSGADWGAAMAEQEAADLAVLKEQENAEDEAELDWGAAMAEQDAADANLQTSASAPVEDNWGTRTEHEISAKPAASSKPTTAAFKDFAQPEPHETAQDIDFILDIPVQLTVELGRAKIAIRNLLQLAQGSVVELDGLAGEPMDVLVNGCLIAQGEVVVVNDKFGIRLTDVITPAERIRKLNR